MKISIDKEKIFKIGRLIAKPVIVITLSAILCTLFANQITKISASVKQAQILNLTLQKRIETISKMKDDLEKIGDANYTKIENTLITTDNITDVIVAFDGLGTKHGMNITPTLSSNLSPTGQQVTSGPRIVTIDYSISTGANVTTFINFLKDFQNLALMPTVSSVDISGQGTSGWAGTSIISMKGKVYLKQD